MREERKPFIRKTDIVKGAVANKDFKKALKIAKGFQMSLTKKQKDEIALAYDCMIHPDFYKQLGMNVDEKIEIGIKTVTLIYG